MPLIPQTVYMSQQGHHQLLILLFFQLLYLKIQVSVYYHHHWFQFPMGWRHKYFQRAIYKLINSQQTQSNPYFMKFLPKQIRICQGCRSGYQHGLNGEPLPPPYDIIIGHFEWQQYSDQVTGLTQLSREACIHYHAFPQCILAKFPDFQPTELSIPKEVFMKLNATHKLFLNSTFGTRL